LAAALAESEIIKELKSYKYDKHSGAPPPLFVNNKVAVESQTTVTAPKVDNR